MTRHPFRLLIVVLLLGWAFNFLFWKHPAGINFAIFMVVSLLGGILLLRSYGIRPARKNLWLIAPFVFFAAFTFLRQEPLTLFLAYAFTLVALGLLAVTYLGGRWPQYSLLDYFSKFFQLTGSLFELPLRFGQEVRLEREARGETFRSLPVKPVLRGLFIAFPIVVCFTYLFASADLVFYQKVVDFFHSFKNGKVVDLFLQLILILGCAYGLAGTFLHAATKSRDVKLLGEDKPVVKPFLGFTESAIILGSVTLLFLMFVSIQFRYFFGGQENIGVEGFTYSEYARRGFNELVAVAFLSLLLTLGLSTITRRESGLQRRVFSGLNIAIVALVLVILVSAYQRLSLAIDWHGFSRLRLYPRVFLIWVGILFVVVVALEVLHRERNFALAAVLASLGFATTLCLINVDASIVHYNVYRATQGKHFNVNFLTTLSTDALPALVDEFNNASLPGLVHEGVGAALVCYQYSQPDTKPADLAWQSFSYSKWAAGRALNQAQGQLAKYRINAHLRPMEVRGPSNVLYICANSPD